MASLKIEYFPLFSYIPNEFESFSLLITLNSFVPSAPYWTKITEQCSWPLVTAIPKGVFPSISASFKLAPLEIIIIIDTIDPL